MTCSLENLRDLESTVKLRKCLPYSNFPLCFLRDLDARAKNECYRATFRLPKDERLDGHTGCTLWTPFNKLHIPGQMFISNNYICFASKEEDACRLIIPLREVSISGLHRALQSVRMEAGLSSPAHPGGPQGSSMIHTVGSWVLIPDISFMPFLC